MSRKKTIGLPIEWLTAVLLTTGLAACASIHPSGHTSSSQDMVSGDKSIPPSFARGLTEWRWVGVKKETHETCPVVYGIQSIPDECCLSGFKTPEKQKSPDDQNCREDSGWKTCHMFGPPQSSSPALRSFCLYQHHGEKPDLKVIDRLMATGKLSSIGPDAMAVGNMAPESLEDISWEFFQEQFLFHAGRAKLIKPLRPKENVRLAILDTAATKTAPMHPEEHPGRSPHGYTLVRMARELLCHLDGNPEACLAQVSTRLALPYIAFDKITHNPTHQDLKHGGFFGTIGDLAQAVREEIADWRKGDRDGRLVLNLSVAWHPIFGGLEENPEQMPPNVLAVFQALEEASCEGVLVIAAAGNRVYGPDPHKGPLMPAGWEQRFAPGQTKCKKNYFIDRIANSQDERPLIYAAGGIRAYKNPKKPALPLSNAIPGGLPKLLSYADHAVVESHKPGVPAAILTGSSVSALVLSATASAVWRYRPSLNPSELMQLIHKLSEPAKLSADFCLGGTPSNPCPSALDARIVRLCKIVDGSCQPGQEACPDYPIECVPISNIETLGELIANPAGATHISCGASTPCPEEIYISASAQPWVLTQPGSNPCPPCRIRRAYSGMLELEIPMEAAGPLTNPTLTVDGTHYSVDLPSTSPGTTAVVNLTGIPVTPESSATLSFQLGASNSVSAPLYVTTE